MNHTDIPSEGDYLVMTSEYPGFSKKHGEIGHVFRVVRVGEGIKTSGLHVYFDHCTCNGSADGHEDFGWTWQSYAQIFERHQILTPEDAEKAKPLPTMEDVESFFKV